LLSSAGKLRVKPAALPERIDQLVAKAKGGSRPKDAPAPSLDLLVEQTAGVPTAAAVVDDDVDVRTTSIREAKERGAVVSLVGRSKGKTRIAVAVPEGLVDQVDARIVLADLLAVVGGNGGGSARFAQGGGAENNDLSVVTERLPLAVRRAVASERA
jgi:alanyl-tRNA synthetase